MEWRENNYAFIDSQNLNLSIKKMGWELDYQEFRRHLAERYLTTKAYMFIGFMAKNQKLYDRLEEAGFSLVFKTISIDADGKIKGNVDADLVLRASVEMAMYDRAVIVSSDGDFCCLVEYLHERNKLRVLLSPDKAHCSWLLKRAAREKINFMNDLRGRLEYKPKRGTS